MQQVRIDFDNPGLPQSLGVVEGESQSRIFQAALYKSGAAYTAPAGAVYSIMYRGFGPQNQGWYDTIEDGAGKRAACTVSGNVVTCELARQALRVPGHLTVVLCVSDAKGYMLKSWPIMADVRNDGYEDTGEIEMYFNLSGLAGNYLTQLEKAMADAEATKNNLISTSTQVQKDIDAKAAETLKTIPESYTELDGSVKQLKEDLDNILEEKIKPEDTTFYKGTYNIFDFTDNSRIIPNAYINGLKGVTQYDGWCCTDYIRVEPNIEYCILGYYSASTGWDYTTDRYCAFYTPKKKYINSFKSGSAFTTPQNCQYIRISIPYASPFTHTSKRILAKYSDVSSFIQTKTPKNYKKTLHNIKADNITELEKTVATINNREISGTALILREKLIPPYYLSTVENPTSYDDIEYLEAKIKNVPSGKHYIFVTDPHWPSNRKNSPALISYIMNRLDIDTVIMGGDILDRSDTKYKGAAELLSYTAIMKSAIGKKYFPVLGNHDINTANTGGYTPEQLEPLIIPYDIVLKNIFPPYIEPDEATKLDSLGLDKETILDLHAYMKCHYHYDDFKNKIRYINIVTGTTNPGNPKTIFGLSNYSELLLQFDWLYDVLMNIPDGFDVVLCGHALVSWGSTASAESDQVKSYALYVMQMLSALKTKGACTVTNDKDNAKLNLYFSAGDHNYDFSNAPNVGTILALGGDTHWDCQCVCHNKSGTYISETISDSTVYQDDSVIAIVTQTDSQGKSSYSGKDYAEKVHKMTSGTVSEQCFDIVTIGDGITFTRIGAGNDRYFDYN